MKCTTQVRIHPELLTVIFYINDVRLFSRSYQPTADQKTWVLLDNQLISEDFSPIPPQLSDKQVTAIALSGSADEVLKTLINDLEVYFAANCG